MIRDGRGEMGFMEAMVSFIAVMMVICLYVAFAATSSVSAHSPLGEIDPEQLFEGTADGPRISGAYVCAYAFEKGLKGLKVTATVPTFFGADGFAYGEGSGAEYTKRFLLLGEYGNGRVLPTILEVTAFVRTRRA